MTSSWQRASTPADCSIPFGSTCGHTFSSRRRLYLQVIKGNTITGSYAECQDLIRQYQRGKLELQPGCNAEQSLVAVVTGKLNTIGKRPPRCSLCWVTCTAVCALHDQPGRNVGRSLEALGMGKLNTIGQTACAPCAGSSAHVCVRRWISQAAA